MKQRYPLLSRLMFTMLPKTIEDLQKLYPDIPRLRLIREVSFSGPNSIPTQRLNRISTSGGLQRRQQQTFSQGISGDSDDEVISSLMNDSDGGGQTTERNDEQQKSRF